MKLKLIDTHAHLNFRQFDTDRAAVIERIKEAGMGVINVGTDLETSGEVIALAEEHLNMWAIVGLHPTDYKRGFDSAAYKELASHPRVVAIGECGLDFYREPRSRKEQVKIFEEQIELANTLKKPLMLHIREAYRDAYEVLKSAARMVGTAHFFAGSWEEAKLFLNLGFSLSFAGPVTFSSDYDEVIKQVPLDKFLVETDSPFAAPTPHRGQRNEPLYVELVIKKVALLRGLEGEEVRSVSLANAARLFGLRVAEKE